MDTSQYLEIFLDETKEHLQNLNTQILELEQEPENMDTINEIFRAAHSLKGMAGTMGYKRMQNLTHDMENVFSEVRNGTIKVQPEMIDILFNCLDALEEYLSNIQQTTDEGTNDNAELIKSLNDMLNKEEKEAKAEKETPVAAAAPVAESTSGNGKEKWREIKLNDTECMLVDKAHGEKLNVFGITVYVDESCVLKAARAFLVFKALEKLGEVIVSVPTAQDIEDEKFDLTFSLIFISGNTKDEVIAAIKSVSEIAEVYCEEYQMTAAPEEKAKEEAAPEPAPAQPEEKQEQPAATTTQAKPATAQPASPAKQEAKKAISKPVVNRTVRVDIEKLDNLMNLVSELIIAKNSLVAATMAQGSDNNSNVNEQIEYLESVTTNIHESVMKVRMVPIESIVSKFPRMIRDLSKKLDKKMELYMTGEDTELDRTVVDEIGDPLMHMLRNSADHGLEPNDVRVAKGKPEVGSIFLDAYQDGNNVVIEVRDDGAGIDTAAFHAAYMAALGRLYSLGGRSIPTGFIARGRSSLIRLRVGRHSVPVCLCIRGHSVLVIPGIRILHPIVCSTAVRYRVTVLRMLMDTACNLGIALLPVFVSAWAFCNALHITAGFIMRRMMFTQSTCFDSCSTVLCCISSGRKQRQAHRQCHQQTYNSFLHMCSPLSVSLSLCKNKMQTFVLSYYSGFTIIKLYIVHQCTMQEFFTTGGTLYGAETGVVLYWGNRPGSGCDTAYDPELRGSRADLP